MNKPIIVILEDSIERIEWILKKFNDKADIRWTTNVNGFFNELRTIDRRNLRLIILDHDLGGIPRSPLIPGGGTSLKASGHYPMDEDGQCGMHAVDTLDAWKDIPCIVWSINSIAAPEMVLRLKDKDFATGWIPFIETNWQKLTHVIEQLII